MALFKILDVYLPFYYSSVSPVKVAILCFYRRIFPLKQLKWLIYAAGSVIVAHRIPSVLTGLFQCSPRESYWLRDKAGTCIDGDEFLLLAGGINCVLDFIVIGLPLPLIWRLRTIKSQKAVLLGIFVCAGFVLIIWMIVRLVVLARLTNADLTWNYVDGAIWSAAGASMGVISACLPSLRPLISLLSRGTVRGLGVSKHGTESGKDLRSPSRGESQRNDRNGFGGFGDLSLPSEPGIRKVGHDVEVRAGHGVTGGRGGDDEISLEAMNPAPGNIQVKDEVLFTSSNWLEYKDEMY